MYEVKLKTIRDGEGYIDLHKIKFLCTVIQLLKNIEKAESNEELELIEVKIIKKDGNY